MIRSAIESVLAQTYDDWELFVIDDNGIGTESQIATAELMRQFADDPRIIYIAQHRNEGACAARNAGIRRAAGTYVAFLDDDDLWNAKKLESQVQVFEEATGQIALVYGGFRRVFEDGHTEVIWPTGLDHLWPRLAQRNGIGSTSVIMCRKSSLESVGMFDETLPAMQDFDLYIRIGVQFSCGYVNDIVADHRRHGGPRITTAHDNIVVANERFFKKHQALFESDADVLHDRLRAFGLALVRAGRFAEGRARLFQAWRAKPTAMSALILACASHGPVLKGYRLVKNIMSKRRTRVDRVRGQGAVRP